jgi:hypothetical protein
MIFHLGKLHPGLCPVMPQAAVDTDVEAARGAFQGWDYMGW